ncbi:hypothetical protein BCR34DRAFT_588253 [Clohesyomyces aquaticus]|uniref:Uncharacterized protein n=1 Tax=Clohesyomyces aquaticus TaxID=1231657 RepID=A0A1Y1ZL62_9PLEO|nr:hypothetical protein BCR34DRAFT_588253 [Clohesyomyces aquaticus]
MGCGLWGAYSQVSPGTPPPQPIRARQGQYEQLCCNFSRTVRTGKSGTSRTVLWTVGHAGEDQSSIGRNGGSSRPASGTSIKEEPEEMEQQQPILREIDSNPLRRPPKRHKAQVRERKIEIKRTQLEILQLEYEALAEEDDSGEVVCTRVG